jgi:hypothetical protein
VRAAIGRRDAPPPPPPRNLAMAVAGKATRLPDSSRLLTAAVGRAGFGMPAWKVAKLQAPRPDNQPARHGTPPGWSLFQLRGCVVVDAARVKISIMIEKKKQKEKIRNKKKKPTGHLKCVWRPRAARGPRLASSALGRSLTSPAPRGSIDMLVSSPVCPSSARSARTATYMAEMWKCVGLFGAAPAGSVSLPNNLP